MSGDYSRKSFKQNKNFSAVLMQQGRVQTDADWNEQSDITTRRSRAQTIDTIGRVRVSPETPGAFQLSFTNNKLLILPGRMYVDGISAENHGDEPYEFDPIMAEERGTSPISYEKQPFLPNPPSLPHSGLYLVYLDVWEREVTYIKDKELIEPAIGVDTTARSQSVYQVKLIELISKTNDVECRDDLDEWKKLIAPSAGRLTIETKPLSTAQDPCLLPGTGGYKGLENRLYRIEIHTGGTHDDAKFKWARHNAWVETNILEIDGSELRVSQSRWDSDRAFRSGDWVEIIDDALELSGDSGVMRQIETVDYATNVVSLKSGASLNTILTDPEYHPRLKRWDQKLNVDPADGLLKMEVGPIELEDGIQIIFSLAADVPDGVFKPRDYWLFAARTATASVEELKYAPPYGVHHHYAKLGIINFSDSSIIDCRPQPKIETTTCCTLTVGDGIKSIGDFQSINAAINKLPREGGKICVLPGTYEENVTINGRSDVVVEGCGKRTLVKSPWMNEGGSDSKPVFHVRNSSGISIQSMKVLADRTGIGIFVEGDRKELVKDVSLDRLFLSASLGSAIEVRRTNKIVIQDCQVTMDDVSGEWPGIYLSAEDALIKNNEITVGARFPESARGLDVSSSARLGRGGIQLGGGCKTVSLSCNSIQYGVGNAITLGSLVRVDQNGNVVKEIPRPPLPDNPCDPCPRETIEVEEADVDSEGNIRSYLRSAGPLEDILIEHNLIRYMGLNGIGAVGIFPAARQLIHVDRLTIRENVIGNCALGVLAPVSDFMVENIGYGGIVLASVENLIVEHNTIEDNGEENPGPICGIFVLHAEGVEIANNHIKNNGLHTRRLHQGQRGGINITLAVAPIESKNAVSTTGRNLHSALGPAARIHNNVVIQPIGRALSLNAYGPVAVSNNYFVSKGLDSSRSANGVTVMLLNMSDLALNSRSLLRFINSGKIGTENASNHLRVSRNQPIIGGNVLFSNNECRLDLQWENIKTLGSSIHIGSKGDIGFHGNQCECELDKAGYLLAHIMLYGSSVRATDNQINEAWDDAVLSGFVAGQVLNMATCNQSAHCLIVANAPHRISDLNSVLFPNSPYLQEDCEALAKIWGKI